MAKGGFGPLLRFANLPAETGTRCGRELCPEYGEYELKLRGVKIAGPAFASALVRIDSSMGN